MKRFIRAIYMGGILAASTVIPEKIHYLAYDIGSLNSVGIGSFAEHSLQLFGSFLVLSVLIWQAQSNLERLARYWRIRPKAKRS